MQRPSPILASFLIDMHPRKKAGKYFVTPSTQGILRCAQNDISKNYEPFQNYCPIFGTKAGSSFGFSRRTAAGPKLAHTPDPGMPFVDVSSPGAAFTGRDRVGVLSKVKRPA